MGSGETHRSPSSAAPDSFRGRPRKQPWGVKVPFLPVTKASMASLPLPLPPVRTFAAPNALKCPRELRVARRRDLEPGGPLGLACICPLGVLGGGLSATVPPLAAGGMKAEVGGVSRPAGWLVQKRGARGRESERVSIGEKARDRETPRGTLSNKQRASTLLFSF